MNDESNSEEEQHETTSQQWRDYYRAIRAKNLYRSPFFTQDARQAQLRQAFESPITPVDYQDQGACPLHRYRSLYVRIEEWIAELKACPVCSVAYQRAVERFPNGKATVDRSWIRRH